MEFKNYCIIGLGDVSGIRDIISKISDISPRCIEQTGVFIGTFSCVMSANELKDVFDRNQRTIFIFEVGDANTSYKIGKENIHDELFGHIENGNNDLLASMGSTIMSEINGMSNNISGTTVDQQQKKELSVEEQLEIAIADEDYIKAAELRDIMKLNKK